jgi:hypothetical protein
MTTFSDFFIASLTERKFHNSSPTPAISTVDDVCGCEDGVGCGIRSAGLTVTNSEIRSSWCHVLVQGKRSSAIPRFNSASGGTVDRLQSVQQMEFVGRLIERSVHVIDRKKGDGTR